MEKFNFNTKLNSACGEDENRPLLLCVHFENGFCYASNSHLVVKQSLELHSILEPQFLDGKCIHKDDFAIIRKFEVATANEDGIQCNSTDGRSAFFEYFDKKGANTPDFDAVMNQFKAKGVDFIGFNPKQMKMIMDALYCPDGYVRVNFGGIDKCMSIDVPGVEDQWAILMPVLVEPTLF
jgi:hypothetical protein